MERFDNRDIIYQNEILRRGATADKELPAAVSACYHSRQRLQVGGKVAARAGRRDSPDLLGSDGLASGFALCCSSGGTYNYFTKYFSGGCQLGTIYSGLTWLKGKSAAVVFEADGTNVYLEHTGRQPRKLRKAVCVGYTGTQGICPRFRYKHCGTYYRCAVIF